jgi:hypothetical protein
MGPNPISLPATPDKCDDFVLFYCDFYAASLIRLCNTRPAAEPQSAIRLGGPAGFAQFSALAKLK